MAGCAIVPDATEAPMRATRSVRSVPQKANPADARGLLVDATSRVASTSSPCRRPWLPPRRSWPAAAASFVGLGFRCGRVLLGLGRRRLVFLRLGLGGLVGRGLFGLGSALASVSALACAGLASSPPWRLRRRPSPWPASAFAVAASVFALAASALRLGCVFLRLGFRGLVGRGLFLLGHLGGAAVGAALAAAASAPAARRRRPLPAAAGAGAGRGGAWPARRRCGGWAPRPSAAAAAARRPASIAPLTEIIALDLAVGAFLDAA